MLRIECTHRNTLSNHFCPWLCYCGDCHLRKPWSWADHRCDDVSLIANSKSGTFFSHVPPAWARSLMLALAVQLPKFLMCPSHAVSAMMGSASQGQVFAGSLCLWHEQDRAAGAGRSMLGIPWHCSWRAAIFSFAREFLLSFVCKTDGEAQEKPYIGIFREEVKERWESYQGALLCLSSIHQALCSKGTNRPAEAGEPSCWQHLSLPQWPADKLWCALPTHVQPSLAESWGLKSIRLQLGEVFSMALLRTCCGAQIPPSWNLNSLLSSDPTHHQVLHQL